MRIAFAGTPDFATQALEALIHAGHEVVAVLTQPDRPAGRGLKLQASSVKRSAQAHQLPVLQPKSLRLDGLHAQEAHAAQQALSQTGAELMVVVAYGLILPAWCLSLFPKGCLNIHASLLPRWRGAAPIQRAIQAGDSESGVCIMQMDEGLDTGAVLMREAVSIARDDSSLTLQTRLAALGARLIVQTLEQLPHLKATAQDSVGTCYAHKISKAESPLDWSKDALTLMRQVLAFNPAPGCSLSMSDQTIKVWDAVALPEATPTQHQTHQAGEIVGVGEEGVDVQCGRGVLRIVQLQRAGHQRMGVKAFLQGHALPVGTRLDLGDCSPASSGLGEP